MSDNERNCYCGLWQTKPDFMREQGLPPGYCGKCERCGQPGHTRHYPGAKPYTGAWCDRCYRIVAWTGPLREPVTWIMVTVAVAIWVMR